MTTDVEPRLSGMWQGVWKLLRLRWLIQISSFKRSKTSSKVITIFVMLAIAVVFVGAFFGSWAILKFLRSAEFAQYVGDVTPILTSVPTLTFTVAILVIFATSFGVMLQALYLSGDMDFLLTSPVPVRSVFFTKLLQAVLPTFGLISLFALPLLWGLGASLNYNFLYYPLVLILLAALSLAVASVSSLVVMCVARVFPARRVAEVVGFLVATTSFICSQSGQFMRYSDNNMETAQFADLLQKLSSLNNPFLPTSWAGQGVVNLGAGNWLAAIAFLVLSLGLAIVIFGVTLVTAEKLYYTGWAKMQVVGHKKKAAVKRENHENGKQNAIQRLLPATVRAVIAKDFKVLRRDLKNLSQLVTPLILGIVYMFMMINRAGDVTAGGSTGREPTWLRSVVEAGLSYGDIIIALFVGWMLSSRLAMMGFSQEGKSYWMIKTSPAKPSHLLLAKFLVAFLPTVLIGWVFLVIMAVVTPGKLLYLPYSLLVVALSGAGLTGINLAFGVAGATFDWKDAQKMLDQKSSCLGTLANFAYFPLALAFFILPAILLGLLPIPGWIGPLVGFVLGAGFSLTCTFVPMRIVLGKVAHLCEG